MVSVTRASEEELIRFLHESSDGCTETIVASGIIPPPTIDEIEQKAKSGALTVRNVVRISTSDLERKRKKESQQKQMEWIDTVSQKADNNDIVVVMNTADTRHLPAPIVQDPVQPTPPAVVAPVIKPPKDSHSPMLEIKNTQEPSDFDTTCSVVGNLYCTREINAVFTFAALVLLESIVFETSPRLGDKWTKAKCKIAEFGAKQPTTGAGDEWVFEFGKKSSLNALVVLTFAMVYEPLFGLFLVYGFEDKAIAQRIRTCIKKIVGEGSEDTQINALRRIFLPSLFFNKTKTSMFLKGPALEECTAKFLAGLLDAYDFVSRAAAAFFWAPSFIPDDKDAFDVDDYIEFYVVGSFHYQLHQNLLIKQQIV